MARRRSPNHRDRIAPGRLTGWRLEHRCVNCDITFDWQPTRVGHAEYCCLGCAEGGPCCCDYDNLPRLPAEQPRLAWVYRDRLFPTTFNDTEESS